MDPTLIERHQEIVALCRLHGVMRLEVFGSAADGTLDPLSGDYDFIARFADQPQTSIARRFFGFADALESTLGRKVDLMTDHEIANPYLRASVNATRVTLYDESAAEALV
jgi:uncharacterized protein